MEKPSLYRSAGSGARRENKGLSKLDFLSDYVVVDLETTGLDPERDGIIEFGAVKVSDGCFTQSCSSLVNPGCEISGFISELTGITNDMLASAPSITDTLPDLIHFLGNSVVVGHNVNFDINFIYENCIKVLDRPFSNDFIDTMRLSRRLFPEHRHHRLCDLKERFGIIDALEHRALADAEQTGRCYEYMKRYVSQTGISHEQLRCASSGCFAKDVRASAEVFDEDSPLYHKVFVFTGALERMTRREAMQLVVNHGGQCADAVSSRTDYLVLGVSDYCAGAKDGKSTKQRKAEQLRLSGAGIEIISENVLRDMLAMA